MEKKEKSVKKTELLTQKQESKQLGQEAGQEQGQEAGQEQKQEQEPDQEEIQRSIRAISPNMDELLDLASELEITDDLLKGSGFRKVIVSKLERIVKFDEKEIVIGGLYIGKEKIEGCFIKEKDETGKEFETSELTEFYAFISHQDPYGQPFYLNPLHSINKFFENIESNTLFVIRYKGEKSIKTKNGEIRKVKEFDFFVK